MSLHDQIIKVQRELREKKDRYYGARGNLREVRARLKVIAKRLPDAQGGVKDDLLKERTELRRRQQKLSYQVNHRREIVKHLDKKLNHLKSHKEPKEVAPGVVVPDRPWNPQKKPVAAWIVPWLDKSWEKGWRGQVNSAWRSPEYSEGLCYGICGQPQCPGTCAGRASGHSQVVYPGGCVDVSDYYTFERIQYQIGSPLRNDLPNDPVHFSTTGH